MVTVGGQVACKAHFAREKRKEKRDKSDETWIEDFAGKMPSDLDLKTCLTAKSALRPVTVTVSQLGRAGRFCGQQNAAVNNNLVQPLLSFQMRAHGSELHDQSKEHSCFERLQPRRQLPAEAVLRLSSRRQPDPLDRHVRCD